MARRTIDLDIDIAGRCRELTGDSHHGGACVLLELAVKFPQPLDSGVIGGLKVTYELGCTSEKEKRMGEMSPPERR